ncbi:MAG: hypothetical protein PVSMB4_12880 [Ktedonobacterales bacterium]
MMHPQPASKCLQQVWPSNFLQANDIGAGVTYDGLDRAEARTTTDQNIVGEYADCRGRRE